MDSVPHSMNRKYKRDYTQKEKGVNGEEGDRKTEKNRSLGPSKILQRRLSPA